MMMDTPIYWIRDVESLPRGVLFWRQLTNAIGGIGIVVTEEGLFVDAANFGEGGGDLDLH